MKTVLLLTACILLTACGQSGRLYLPNRDTTIQITPDTSNTHEPNNTVRQDAWPR